MEEIKNFELTKEFIDALREAIAQQQSSYIQSLVNNYNIQDLSTILEELDFEESKYVLDLTSPEKRASIINELEEDIQSKFLKEYSPAEIAEIIENLDSDDAVDILGELSAKEREEVIAQIENPEKEANIVDLLRYEADVAGGLMAKELIKANAKWNVVQTIEEIRRQAENVQKIYSVYVVDDHDILLGRIALKKIILSEDNTKISDIYDSEIISVQASMEEEEVAAVMRKYDLEAIPVTNLHGKLLGRITVDDILDVITEMADEERQLMSGITEDIEEDDSIWILTRARLPWLVIGVIGGLISAEFMGLFEKDIMSAAWIALFLPLIQATGGNVGIQSSSIVVQSLANPSLFKEGMWKRLSRVFIVALINGIALGALVFVATYFMNYDLDKCFIVSFALFFVVLLSSIVGTATPLTLNSLGFNPALASGPFITTLNDILGLAIYFYTIHLLL